MIAMLFMAEKRTAQRDTQPLLSRADIVTLLKHFGTVGRLLVGLIADGAPRSLDALSLILIIGLVLLCRRYEAPRTTTMRPGTLDPKAQPPAPPRVCRAVDDRRRQRAAAFVATLRLCSYGDVANKVVQKFLLWPYAAIATCGARQEWHLAGGTIFIGATMIRTRSHVRPPPSASPH